MLSQSPDSNECYRNDHAAMIYEKISNPNKTYTVYPNSTYILTLSPNNRSFSKTPHIFLH